MGPIGPHAPHQGHCGLKGGGERTEAHRGPWAGATIRLGEPATQRAGRQGPSCAKANPTLSDSFKLACLTQGGGTRVSGLAQGALWSGTGSSQRGFAGDVCHNPRYPSIKACIARYPNFFSFRYTRMEKPMQPMVIVGGLGPTSGAWPLAASIWLSLQVPSPSSMTFAPWGKPRRNSPWEGGLTGVDQVIM